jgi:flagellar basal-body rod protein FlgF
MDNLQLLGVQTQRVLQRRMETAANNLANVSTAGFKADSLLTEVDSRRPARSQDAPRDVRFVRDVGMSRNFSQGSITRTGEAFDVAIQGEGFFIVADPQQGTLYTRDGGFRLDAAGQLVTKDGRNVLNAGGAPIVFDPQGERPSISSDGSIQIAGTEVGRIGLVNFANPGALEKVGDNLFSAAGQPTSNFEGAAVQGALEGSNVNAVIELTRVIEISRAYESAARIVKNGDDLRQRTIERFGRA